MNLVVLRAIFAHTGVIVWPPQTDNEKRLGYMELNRALYAPVDDGGGAGGGASGGEKEGSDKSNDDVVPKTQFIAALSNAERKHEREMRELRAEMDAKLAAVAKPAPAEAKRYNRADLNLMVVNGQITQEQADAQMDYQVREEAKAEAQRVATETVTAEQHKVRVETEIARYKAVAPEILDDAHETRQRIKEEFQNLVELGDNPRSLVTQLKAIRAVLGPADKLERARGGKPAHESHREYGDEGAGHSDAGRKKSGALTYDGLSPREKAHYDNGLRTGLYADKAAINAELAFARPHIRQKYGSR